jgi:hypothetical protein
LSNWQNYVSRHIIMIEEPASLSPHFRSFSSYRILRHLRTTS